MNCNLCRHSQDDVGQERCDNCGVPLVRAWRLTFVCCGREDGFQEFDSWDEANAVRNCYITGPAVDPHGYSGSGYNGHQRAGIITRQP